MDFYELEGNKDLARDPKTNAIVNVNGLDYSQYLLLEMLNLKRIKITDSRARSC